MYLTLSENTVDAVEIKCLWQWYDRHDADIIANTSLTAKRSFANSITDGPLVSKVHFAEGNV